ncbi:hypothetical protein EMIT0P294_20351 [Pseudomonas sp. IT-P294]
MALVSMQWLITHHRTPGPKFNRCVDILDGYYSLINEESQGGRANHGWCGLDRYGICEASQPSDGIDRSPKSPYSSAP